MYCTVIRNGFARKTITVPNGINDQCRRRRYSISLTKHKTQGSEPRTTAESKSTTDDNMPSNFDEILGKFRDLIRQIEIRYHDKENASDLLKKCRRLMTKLERETMNAEGASHEQECIDTVLACKMQLQSYSLINDQRDELFFGAVTQKRQSGARDGPPSDGPPAGKQSDLVRNALRTMLETEEIGLEIGKELHKNREKLQSAKGNVDQLQEMTGQANNMLTSMIRRSKRWF